MLLELFDLFPPKKIIISESIRNQAMEDHRRDWKQHPTTCRTPPRTVESWQRGRRWGFGWEPALLCCEYQSTTEKTRDEAREIIQP